jgi:glutamate-ammonia-ligase adenylyltransferase
MTTFSRHIDPQALPRPFDAARAEAVLADWRAQARDSGLAALARLSAEPALEALLRCLFGNSPYLGRSLFRETAFCRELFTAPPDQTRARLLEDLRCTAPGLTGMAELMRALRIAKTRIALLCAAADVAGLWALDDITATLSNFAALALDLAVAHLLRARMVAGDLAWPDEPGAPATPALARASGYAVLAMGKLGAGELNYSSDIDLIILFDPQTVRYGGKRDMQDCFIRLTRQLVRIMQERTAEGYVFRTDLRLRPDAGATPIALSLDAAEIYYQSVGLNWERAAMIKARPIAGDLATGRDFLERIRPFVWRKHLDFAAVADIHAIKMQIHQHHHHQEDQLAGYDVKLGRGGIREIEFFAQIQQLIAGGRDPRLREPTTKGALRALCSAGMLEPAGLDELLAAYDYLRRLEHRLQMINDEQTQKMPESDGELDHVAAFMGYATREDLSHDLRAHRHRVIARYDALFHDTQTIDEAEMPTAPDPAALGFTDPDKTRALVTAWEHGRYRACRSERARALLRKLTPTLLRALAATAEPDAALLRFDEFLSNLPSGVQLFSLFQAHPWLLELIAEIMGSAPGLATVLGRNVLLLDAVLSPDFFAPLPGLPALKRSLAEVLEGARDFQDHLDLSRRWTNERKFQIGVLVLRHLIDMEAAGHAQSDLAEAVIATLLPVVERDFAQKHGVLERSGLAIVALGKLGGRQMTVTSDLDLIFLYDGVQGNGFSNGPKPLPPSLYYARLSQRLINALSALTGEGQLYEVDMRLRPSGKKGPIAVSLDAFTSYHDEDAWTWERMSLTRARVIAGPENLQAAARAAIEHALRRARPEASLRREVAQMRQRLAQEFASTDCWQVKYVRGGLLDLEFIAQYLQLKSRTVFAPDTGEAFARLAEAGEIAPALADELIAATRLQQAVQGYLRLCFGEEFREQAAPEGLRRGLAVAAGMKDFAGLKTCLIDTQKRVYEIYQDIFTTS